jgi:hypothetical protein
MKLYFLLCSIILSGCSIIPNTEVIGQSASGIISNSNQEQIEQTEEIEIASENISNDLTDIDSNAELILNTIALEENPENYNGIVDSTNNIKESVDHAQQEQIRISEALEDLKQANHETNSGLSLIRNTEKELEKVQESDLEVRRQALENLHSFITLFFVIGFGMLVAGAFIAFWVNGKLGTVILGIGILTVGFASASQYYLEEIATIGLIILIIGFVATSGIIAWMLIKGRGNEKAIKEIVELIEAMKEKLSPEERKEIFGKGNLASQLTSDLTKKIVAEVKIKNGFKKQI